MFHFEPAENWVAPENDEDAPPSAQEDQGRQTNPQSELQRDCQSNKENYRGEAVDNAGMQRLIFPTFHFGGAETAWDWFPLDQAIWIGRWGTNA